MNAMQTTMAGCLYKEGKNTSEIGRILNISKETARHWVINSGTEIRSRKERQQSYKRNSNAFSIISPRSAYYAGFIMADGNISKKSKSLNVELQLRDIEVIKGLKDFLGYEGPTRFRKRKGKTKTIELVYFSICDEKILGDLAKWGIIPNKNIYGKIPKWVICDELISRHFMRGLFDGDGCIHLRKNGGAFSSFANNKTIATQFNDWIKTRCGDIGGIDKRKKTWVAQYGYLSAVKMLTAIYQDSDSEKLSRKYDLFVWIKKYQT